MFPGLAFKSLIFPQNYVNPYGGVVEMSYIAGNVLFTACTQFCSEFEILIKSISHLQSSSFGMCDNGPIVCKM